MTVFMYVLSGCMNWKGVVVYSKASDCSHYFYLEKGGSEKNMKSISVTATRLYTIGNIVKKCWIVANNCCNFVSAASCEAMFNIHLNHSVNWE